MQVAYAAGWKPAPAVLCIPLRWNMPSVDSQLLWQAKKYCDGVANGRRAAPVKHMRMLTRYLERPLTLLLNHRKYRWPPYLKMYFYHSAFTLCTRSFR
jgi:hypothetical protein